MDITYTAQDLTVVICAYKECKTLEDCIQSITGQTEKPRLMISTSTPNDYIRGLAEKYQLEVRVNPEGGHVKDYNFALNQIRTPLGMLAHQDDLLHPMFVEKNIQALNRAKHPILAFSNYIEMHNDIVDKKASGLVKIKRMLVWPARVPGFRRTVFNKRILQCLGNPITHPSVVCVMSEIPQPCFEERFRASMDWDLWERLSHKKGEFVYIKDVVLYHRMNDENATSILLENTNCRYEEEFEIMNRFWPKWITRIIMKFYSKSAQYY